MATPRTTKTQKIAMPPGMPTSEVLAAAIQEQRMNEPLTGTRTVLPSPQYDEEAEKLVQTVRKKGLALAEKIIDKCETAPLDTVHLNNVTKAIELYNAFK